MRITTLPAISLVIWSLETSAQNPPPRPPSVSMGDGPVEEVTCPKGYQPIPDEVYRKAGQSRQDVLRRRAMFLKAGGTPDQIKEDLKAQQPGMPEEFYKDPFLGQLCETPQQRAERDGQSNEAAKAKTGAATDVAAAAAGAAGGGKGAVGAAAAPVIGKIAGGLMGRFGRKPPNADAIAKDLSAGRYEMKDFVFKAEVTEFSSKPELLQLLQEAFGRTEGKFIVFVPSEQASGEPNETLRAERTMAIHAMLLASSIAADRLVLPNDAPPGAISDKDRQPMKKGTVRPVLIRLPE